MVEVFRSEYRYINTKLYLNTLYSKFPRKQCHVYDLRYQSTPQVEFAICFSIRVYYFRDCTDPPTFKTLTKTHLFRLAFNVWMMLCCCFNVLIVFYFLFITTVKCLWAVEKVLRNQMYYYYYYYYLLCINIKLSLGVVAGGRLHICTNGMMCVHILYD